MRTFIYSHGQMIGKTGRIRYSDLKTTGTGILKAVVLTFMRSNFFFVDSEYPEPFNTAIT